ncbi:MAG TPA: transcription-repair coupling factor [Gammaproteobacteria bacterium]|nr:transcription-repair coupling factor [Gammaproteobacteria bacterium]
MNNLPVAKSLIEQISRPSKWTVSLTSAAGSTRERTLGDLLQPVKRPLLIVCATAAELQPTADAIHFFQADDLSPPLIFHDWEMLPYDHFSVDQDLISDRLSVLHQLRSLKSGAAVVTLPTLMQRLPPVEYLDSHSLWIDCNQTLDLETFKTRLVNAGYTLVNQVIAHGDFALRGGILDLFPMGSNEPYRIELLDDQVESIRAFDPETQRSTSSLDQIHLLPGREFPVTEESIRKFHQNYQTQLQANASQAFLYKELKAGRIPTGIEFYFPLFFEQTATLLDFLPTNCVLVQPQGAFEDAEIFWRLITDRFDHRTVEVDRPPLAPSQLYLQANELFAELKNWPLIKTERDPTTTLPDVRARAHSDHPLKQLANFIEQTSHRVLLVAETNGRREALLTALSRSGLQPQPATNWHDFLSSSSDFAITVSPLVEGLVDEEAGIAVITESMLYGQQQVARRHRQKRDLDLETIVRDLSELHVGDPVVHVDHGVGRYQGLEVMALGDTPGEFLCLEYAQQAKVYVPVDKLELIHRYSGAAGASPPLHKLGTSQWSKSRQKAEKRARDTAAELLEIYARRAAQQGHAYPVDDNDYRLFSNSFPYEETPDQQNAIDAVIADLTAPHPMDRIVCGDVGFGKTEVAVRAAFVVAAAGRQVAILVPTTLLVQQHTENFQDRFANTPYRVEGLSRFQTPKEQKAIEAELATGNIDVIVGTHKLLGKGIEFANLGLLVIDEEHRFGVRQKERFKALRAQVDILNLTATPIPRTLSMAVSGLRDISFIATPPQRRVPVKTFVRSWDPLLIKEACQREFSRGGQVYLIHNRVETISKIARDVAELLPDASIRVAHGQLPERELEKIMLDFTHQRFNLLICTTIVESGIDVPSANTIIIDRADHLGLAQLHQLRGRVGRSHHQAYAYILVPDRTRLQGDALQRLEAIEALGDLGVGFSLASHDLEIRGAGELLGDKQSGRAEEIGLTLYNELLERSVADLKAGRGLAAKPAVHQPVEIDLHIPALIPEDYLPDVHARLVLYKRIGACSDSDSLNEIEVELIDRFGLLPESAKSCFRLAEIKLHAAPLGIEKITCDPEQLVVKFSQTANIDVDALIALIQSQPRKYRFDGATRLQQAFTSADYTVRHERALELVHLLTPDGN